MRDPFLSMGCLLLKTGCKAILSGLRLDKVIAECTTYPLEQVTRD